MHAIELSRFTRDRTNPEWKLCKQQLLLGIAVRQRTRCIVWNQAREYEFLSLSVSSKLSLSDRLAIL